MCRAFAIALILVSGRTSAAQEPEPVPGPVPAPAPPPAPFPVAPPAPPVESIAPEQGAYGVIFEVAPAHRLAMMEAGGPVPSTDPNVGKAAALLTRVTAGYVEDAPRIAELAIRASAAIRAMNRPASPLEILEGATGVRRLPSFSGNRPRTFEAYAAAYRALRLKGGKDHAQAIATIRDLEAPASPRTPERPGGPARDFSRDPARGSKPPAPGPGPA